jgi:hypothetical protein
METLVRRDYFTYIRVRKRVRQLQKKVRRDQARDSLRKRSRQLGLPRHLAMQLPWRVNSDPPDRFAVEFASRKPAGKPSASNEP